MKKLFFILIPIILFGYEFHLFSVDDGLSSNSIHSVACDKQTNTIWAGTFFMPFGDAYGLNRYKDGQWTNFANYFDCPLLYDFMHDIEVDSDGGVWVACFPIPSDRGGVMYFDGISTWMVIDTSWGLSSNPVRMLDISHSDHIWFESYPNYWIYQKDLGTLKEDSLGIFASTTSFNLSLAVIDSNTTAISSGDSIVIFNDTSFYGISVPPRAIPITDIEADSDGRIWCSNGSLLFYYYDDIWTECDISGTEFCYYIRIDSKDNVWFSGGDYVKKYQRDPETFLLFDLPPSISGGSWAKFDIDSLDNIWIPTSHGVLVFNEDRIIWGIEEPSISKPNELQLITHPNPFNNNCEIRLSNYENYQGDAEIQIFDVCGKLVETGIINKATYLWDAKGEASGIYLVVVRLGDRTVSGKVVYLS